MADRQGRVGRLAATGDLLWAGYLLLLAAGFGLLYHWPLVKIAWKGELPAHLEKMRDERRAVEFKGVKTVSLQEAHDLFKSGQTLFIDARTPEEFSELHIPGAKNIPPDQLVNLQDTGLLGLPRDRQMVVYCGEKQCDKAFQVARALRDRGFTRVMAFLDGFKAWDEAGYEADSSR